MWQVRVYDVEAMREAEGPTHTEWFPIEGLARHYAEALESEGYVALVLDMGTVQALNIMKPKGGSRCFDLATHTLHLVLCDGSAAFDLDCGCWLESYACTTVHAITLEVVADAGCS